MTPPNLTKLLVIPALKRWLTIHEYGYQENYPLKVLSPIAGDIIADVFATSRVHQSTILIKPVRAIAPQDIRPLVKSLRQWRAVAERTGYSISIAVPYDGISFVTHEKLEREDFQVILLENTMTEKQFAAWHQALEVHHALYLLQP